MLDTCNDLVQFIIGSFVVGNKVERPIILYEYSGS